MPGLPLAHARGSFLRSFPYPRLMRAPTLLLPLLLAGCTIGGSSTPARENDRLRREAIAAQDAIRALELERNELRQKVAELAAGRKATLPDDALAALPRVASLEIGRLSGLTPLPNPASPDAPATSIVLSLTPQDGRGRFTQLVGTARAEALVLPADAAEQPRRIASVTLSPAALRDAYRSGLTGTHYTIDLPLDPPLPRSATARPSIVLRVEFDDALTGQTLRAERLVNR